MVNIITLKNVIKSYDGLTVLNNINLSIEEGKFITILGPSGCGKTTLLRIISGFEKPTDGKIYFYQNDITEIPPYKRPFNTIFQNYALFPHLNVYENVAFGLRLKKIPFKINKNGKEITKFKHINEDEIKFEVLNALRIVDLEDLENRSIDTLSGGQQQRVAIARAIVNKPKILLLDESLSALDTKLRKEMQLELKEMHEKLGITFIYVTHDQEEALTMSDTIIILKDGIIQQIGSPIQIYNEPKNAFVADFIGESNIYNATIIQKNKIRFLNWIWDCDNNFDINENVDVVIRPEDVILTKAMKDNLVGKIETKFFKGIHYEYIVTVGKMEIQVKDTRDLKINSNVSIKIKPENIQIMKKECELNVYYNAYINKNNNLVIGEGDEFDCDITQILKNSSVDENGFLIFGKTKYDLENADVIAKIKLKDIEISDNLNESKILGTVLSSIWKGDHYQILVKSNNDNDYVIDSQYSWDIGNLVSIIVKKENIKFDIKGSISKYEKRN
ncbi:ABC transporter ATP-binding protein [bacterium]|nr:ABC transporter ATP-binding protein [bacterium]